MISALMGVVRSVHCSLERMGLDCVDIVYIHDAMGQPIESVLADDGALGALRHLQRQGLLRYIGTASNDPATNLEYIKTGEFDAAVMADSWSLINLTAEQGVFAAAAEHDVGLVAATPIERGLLVTGPRADMKYLNRRFSQECLDQVSMIQQLCAGYGGADVGGGAAMVHAAPAGDIYDTGRAIAAGSRS